MRHKEYNKYRNIILIQLVTVARKAKSYDARRQEACLSDSCPHHFCYHHPPAYLPPTSLICKGKLCVDQSECWI